MGMQHTAAQGFAKLPGILTSGLPMAISETASKTNLAQGSRENTPAPAYRSQEAQAHWLAAGTGLV